MKAIDITMIGTIVVLLVSMLGQFAIGNIIIAARCNDGIVIASDSTPYSSGRSKSTLKPSSSAKTVIPLNNEITIAILDGSSKFHHLFRELQTFIREYQFDSSNDNDQKDDLDIYSIAKYARRLIATKYPREHILLAGFSRYHDSHCLYEIMQQGSLIACDFAVGGSGGPIAQSLLDDLFREHNSDRISDSSQRNFDPFASMLPANNNKQKKKQGLAIGTSSSQLKLKVKDVLPTVQRAMRIATTLDQRSAPNKIDLWVLEDSNGKD